MTFTLSFIVQYRARASGQAGQAIARPITSSLFVYEDVCYVVCRTNTLVYKLYLKMIYHFAGNTASEVLNDNYTCKVTC